MSTITRSDRGRQVRRLSAIVECLPAPAFILDVLEGPGQWRSHCFRTRAEMLDIRDYAENVLGVPTQCESVPAVVVNRADPLPF